MAGIEHVLHIRAARHLVVDQLRVRRIHNRQARLPGPQAEIHVVVDDLVRLVEPADAIEDVAAHQHAGTGDSRDIPLRERQAEITRIVLGQESKRMAAGAERGQKYPGMLDLAVRIEQLRPDNPHLRTLRMFQQGVQPVLLLHLDIVIEEQQRTSPPLA